MSKLRILCLHGFTSNGSIQKHQVRKITKAFSSDFEFLYPDGPHKVFMTNDNSEKPESRAWVDYVAANSNSGHCAWWFAKDPSSTTGEPGHFKGLEKSLEYIGDFMDRSGPIDAIWGFSQGGCFAGFLTALLHDKQKDHPFRKYLPKQQGAPKVGLIFSGFKPKFSQYDSVYEHGIEIPTLHIMGKKDMVVTLERSEVLRSVCTDARSLKHHGGHNIPDSNEDVTEIVNFLAGALESRSREVL